MTRKIISGSLIMVSIRILMDNYFDNWQRSATAVKIRGLNPNFNG